MLYTCRQLVTFYWWKLNVPQLAYLGLAITVWRIFALFPFSFFFFMTWQFWGYWLGVLWNARVMSNLLSIMLWILEEIPLWCAAGWPARAREVLSVKGSRDCLRRTVFWSMEWILSISKILPSLTVSGLVPSPSLPSSDSSGVILAISQCWQRWLTIGFRVYLLMSVRDSGASILCQLGDENRMLVIFFDILSICEHKSIKRLRETESGSIEWIACWDVGQGAFVFLGLLWQVAEVVELKLKVFIVFVQVWNISSSIVCQLVSEIVASLKCKQLCLVYWS